MDVFIKERIERYSIPITESGCHAWTGALMGGRDGYACLRIQNKSLKVTRLIMSDLLDRPLLPNEHVLHKCDVKCCVNPDHLRIGKHKDNMEEAWDRRPPKRKGEGIGRAKLTIEQVKEIRLSKDPIRKLARRYGVASSTIHFARHKATWDWVL